MKETITLVVVPLSTQHQGDYNIGSCSAKQHQGDYNIGSCSAKDAASRKL